MMTAPVAASPSDLFTSSDSEEDGWISISTIKSGANGLIDRVTYKVETFGDNTTGTDDAKDFRQAFASNKSNFTSWANARTTANTSYDVIKIEFNRNGETGYAYVVSDVNSTSGDYENVQTLNRTEFQSTTRTVDHTITLEDNAADNAHRELDAFNEMFAGNGSDVTGEYLSEMATEYGTNVESTFDV